MGIKPKTKLHWARKFNALRKYYQLPSIATQGVDLHPVASTRPDPAPLKAFKKPCWFRAPVININVGVAKGDFSWFRAALNVRFFESVRLGQYCPVKMKLRPVWYIVYLYLSHHLPIKLDFSFGGRSSIFIKTNGLFRSWLSRYPASLGLEFTKRFISCRVQSQKKLCSERTNDDILSLWTWYISGY